MNQLGKEYFFTILEKQEAGIATEEELAFLDAYYKAFGLRPGLIQSLQDHEKLQMKSELLEGIRRNISSSNEFLTKNRKIKIYKRLVSAAAILMVVGLSLYLYNNMKSAMVVNLQNGSDIGPGTHSATLTLANGKKIVLSGVTNGELAKEAGVTISKANDGQIIYEFGPTTAAESAKAFNTLSTAKGETYRVILPDGSKIWLNSASSVTYPTSFSKEGKRCVELRGEAYFEISKDKNHPFIVASPGQNVEVLGTHFNVNSYADEPNTVTTLLEGSVKVSQLRKNFKVKTLVLRPAQQSINNQTSIEVVSVDVRRVMAWKNGDFIFKDEDFKTIMRKIARWYNVEIFYDTSAPDELRLEGVISRNKNISEVLRIMEATEKVHFKIEGRKITVTE